MKYFLPVPLMLLIVGAIASVSVMADEAAFPYDETVDAESEVAVASVAARDSNRLLLINFGANWCPDCRSLARALSAEPLASLVNTHFVSVKVDVGNWDKHQVLSKRYGDPAANGIPAIVVVDRTGAVRYATRAGELATARNMQMLQLQTFFERLISQLHLAEP